MPHSASRVMPSWHLNPSTRFEGIGLACGDWSHPRPCVAPASSSPIRGCVEYVVLRSRQSGEGSYLSSCCRTGVMVLRGGCLHVRRARTRRHPPAPAADTQPALGKKSGSIERSVFSSQSDFAEWLAIGLDDRGIKVALSRDCSNQYPEWPRVLDLEIDGVEYTVRPGTQTATGEPNSWMWLLGLAPVKPELVGSIEMLRVIRELNERWPVNVARGHMTDASLLSCIVAITVVHSDTHVALSGMCTWPDTLDELVRHEGSGNSGWALDADGTEANPRSRRGSGRRPG
jgi:hypothetical protein